MKTENQIRFLCLWLTFFLLLSACISLLGLVIYHVFDIELFIILLLTLLFALLLEPLITMGERNGFSRIQTVGVIGFLSVGICILLGIIFIPQIYDEAFNLTQNFPTYTEEFITKMKEKEALLQQYAGQWFPNTNLSEQIIIKTTYYLQNFLKVLPGYISLLLNTLFFVPLFVFFILKDAPTMKRKIFDIVPNRYFEMSWNLLYQVNKKLGEFIRARTLEVIIIGAIVFIGLFLLKVKYSFLFGIFAGITTLIPYLGPILGTLPGLIFGFLEYDTSTMIWIVAVYGFANVIDMLYVFPVLIGKMINLHPLTIIISIIIGGKLLGIIGMILFVPLVSILKVTIQEFFYHVVHFKWNKSSVL